MTPDPAPREAIPCPPDTFPVLDYPPCARTPGQPPTTDDPVTLIEWRPAALVAAFAIRDGAFWASTDRLWRAGEALPDVTGHPVRRLAREGRFRSKLATIAGELGVGHLVVVGQVAADPAALVPGTPEFVAYDLYAPALTGRPTAPHGYLTAPLFDRVAAGVAWKVGPEVYQGYYDPALVAHRAGGPGLLDARQPRAAVLLKLTLERTAPGIGRVACVVGAGVPL